MRQLSLAFDLPLHPRDIAGFRGALAGAAGFDADLFHNHDNEHNRLHYRYPLIQYRSERDHAALIGLDAGADAILEWYANSNGTVAYNGERHLLAFRKLDVAEYEMSLRDTPKIYRLYQWLPLNQHRYAEWQDLAGLGDRIAELERLLSAHILTFCRAVDWRLPRRFDLRIRDLGRSYTTGFLGVRHQAFDLEFSCDLLLPPGIGLGKGVSHGFGVLREPAAWKPAAGSSDKRGA